MVNHHDFRSLDKSIKKQRIIDNAAVLFHKKGYSSTTLDDVSKELGITKAALYHYVQSKEELLSVIYAQAIENIFRETYEIAAMTLSPDEKLRRIIRHHIKNVIIKDLSMFSVFFSEESKLPEKEFRRIRKEKKKYTRMIEEIIQEGVSKGLFKKVDPKLQAYAILGMCNWIYKWYRPDKSFYEPERIADHFIAMLETGYLKEAEKDDRPGLAISKGPGKKRKIESKGEILRALKVQSRSLIELINELEE